MCLSRGATFCASLIELIIVRAEPVSINKAAFDKLRLNGYVFERGATFCTSLIEQIIVRAELVEAFV